MLSGAEHPGTRSVFPADSGPSVRARLDTHNALSATDVQYLRDTGLFDLVEFVKDLEARGKPDFRILRRRIELEHRRAVRRELFDKYGFDFVDRSDMGKLMQILTRIERGKRFDDADVLWLKDNDYFTEALAREFHRREAVLCVQAFEQSGNPWEAVNASSHYRKADLAAEALAVAGGVQLRQQRDRHLKSAICTTMGGAKRDLGRREEALALHKKAMSTTRAASTRAPCSVRSVTNSATTPWATNGLTRPLSGARNWRRSTPSCGQSSGGPRAPRRSNFAAT